jgi:hypothetical protein
MLISLAQCSQRPIDIIEELDAISIDCAKNGLFVHSVNSYVIDVRVNLRKPFIPRAMRSAPIPEAW